ncbi:MAG: glycosyltransferase [Acidimicrobiia bacterium]|nr:glycosyltransferase [Acidimicrobiia bacterium]
MTERRAVIVGNLKAGGGAARRTHSMATMLQCLDYSVKILRPELNRRRPPSRQELRLLAGGYLVPEALSWNVAGVASRVAAIAPKVTVLQTTRAVHPAVLAAARSSRDRDNPVVILDLVDRLSSSYRQRASMSNPAAAAAFRCLSAAHRRFEHRICEFDGPVLAAGYTEAASLGVSWIPITVDQPAEQHTVDFVRRPYDAAFFGTLSYQPNIEALRVLDDWSRKIGGRHSILVAGRRPTMRVERLCRKNGWSLVSDFPSVPWVANQARVAVAPLRSTTGIQTKVLEAGQVGLAQVVTSAALAGMDPGVPLVGADDAHAFFRELDRLLTGPELVARQVESYQQYLATNLVAEAVAPRLEKAINDHHRPPVRRAM